MTDHYDNFQFQQNGSTTTTTGHRILPGEVSLPDLSNVPDGQDAVDVVRRENRAVNKNPMPDRIELAPSGPPIEAQFPLQPGDDLEIPFSASYDLGATAYFVLTARNQQGALDRQSTPNILDIQSTTDTSGTIVFSNIDKNASFLFPSIENDSNYRVSKVAPFKLGMDANQDPHSDLPSGIETGSRVEKQRVQEDETVRSINSLNEVSSVIFDIIELHHNIINVIEEHVNAMVGLDYNQLTLSQVQNATEITEFSRLFPQGYRGTKPQGENDDFMAGNFTVDDEAEYAQLNDALGSVSSTSPATITNTTIQENVEYESDSELQDRIDEIEALINGGTLQTGDSTNGFNSEQSVNDLFSRRYFWVNQYCNRRKGFKTKAKSQQNGEGQSNETAQQSNEMESAL